jgi:transcriptional regulator with XRE-family HTH domain
MARRPAFSDQIRDAIERCGMTRYRVAKEIGCSAALLNQFANGVRGLSIPMLDRLAALLQLEVTMHGPTRATLARAHRLVRTARRK